MPTRKLNFTPYYPPALERHVFSPERSTSPAIELNGLSGSLQSSLALDNAQSDSKEPPNSEDDGDGPSDSDDEVSISSRPSHSSSIGSSDSPVEEDVVPKPKGSLGKPGNGGYSLFQALGWDTEDYRATQVYIRSLAQEHLDETISFSLQDPAIIAELCRQADRKFPRLKSYRDRWATKDFLASYHKNSAPKTRAHSRQKTRHKRSPLPSGGQQARASSSKRKIVAFEDNEANEAIGHEKVEQSRTALEYCFENIAPSS